MAINNGLTQIDEPLVARVAALSRGSQRQLKTVLQALASVGEIPELVDVDPGERAGTETEIETESRPNPATLEDVITGKADLREHLEAYPELSEELDGMADVIDLLREAGERRRRRGEQILREEILGEEPETDADGDEGKEPPGPRQRG